MFNRTSRDVHLAISEHFYLLAQDEISGVDPTRQQGDSALEELIPRGALVGSLISIRPRACGQT